MEKSERCGICNAGFESKADLNIHIATAHEFLCTDCNLGFYSREYLRKHVETVHTTGNRI